MVFSTLLEKEVATHSSIIAWEIPWAEKGPRGMLWFLRTAPWALLPQLHQPVGRLLTSSQTELSGLGQETRRPERPRSSWPSKHSCDAHVHRRTAHASRGKRSLGHCPPEPGRGACLFLVARDLLDSRPQGQRLSRERHCPARLCPPFCWVLLLAWVSPGPWVTGAGWGGPGRLGPEAADGPKGRQ